MKKLALILLRTISLIISFILLNAVDLNYITLYHHHSINESIRYTGRLNVIKENYAYITKSVDQDNFPIRVLDGFHQYGVSKKISSIRERDSMTSATYIDMTVGERYQYLEFEDIKTIASLGYTGDMGWVENLLGIKSIYKDILKNNRSDKYMWAIITAAPNATCNSLRKFSVDYIFFVKYPYSTENTYKNLYEKEEVKLKSELNECLSLKIKDDRLEIYSIKNILPKAFQINEKDYKFIKESMDNNLINQQFLDKIKPIKVNMFSPNKIKFIADDLNPIIVLYQYNKNWKCIDCEIENIGFMYIKNHKKIFELRYEPF